MLSLRVFYEVSKKMISLLSFYIVFKFVILLCYFSSSFSHTYYHYFSLHLYERCLITTFLTLLFEKVYNTLLLHICKEKSKFSPQLNEKKKSIPFLIFPRHSHPHLKHRIRHSLYTPSLTTSLAAFSSSGRYGDALAEGGSREK